MPVLIGIKESICGREWLILAAENIACILAAAWPEHEAASLKRRWVAKVDADETRNLACDRLVFVRRDAPIGWEDGAQPWMVLGMTARTIDGVCDAETCDAADDALRLSRCDGVKVKRDEVAALDIRRLALEAFQCAADLAAYVLEPALLLLRQGVVLLNGFICARRCAEPVDKFAPEILGALPLF